MPQKPTRSGSAIATIDQLLDKVDSKYSLVHLAARRAREINNYYHSLGEGLGQYTPPLVDEVDSNKPLSIALEEIAAEKIVMQRGSDARLMAEDLLGGDAEDTDDEGAQVVNLDGVSDADANSADSEPEGADTDTDGQ